ncbi:MULTISPECIES: site-specific integrase [unclassified Caballeronia]|uniref:integrase n=1 Tax=unclassified Caballeronia TaxID=2646786 RepID=UPI00202830D2|nr:MULTISPECIES: site-specific integrase [unclassified Caballeronia]
MGTLQERPNGNWTGKIRRSGFPSLSQTFRHRFEAAAWVAEQEAALEKRIAAVRAAGHNKRIASEGDSRYLLFGDLMRRYLEEVSPQKDASGEEAIRMRGLLKHSIAACPVGALNGARVAEWRNERLKSVSGSTVRRDKNLLSHVVEIARNEWEVNIDPNPFKRVRMPREGLPRERRLSPAEEAALLAACSETWSPFIRPIVILALETAMRRSEIIGLTWERVFLSEPSVQLVHTKTGKPRGIPLSRRAVAVLQELRPNSPEGAQLKGSVFPGFTANALKLAFRRAVERAKIKGLRFHDLRHEATSRLFEKRLAVMEVASITGHQDVRMLRRYTHLQVRDLARKLD